MENIMGEGKARDCAVKGALLAAAVGLTVISGGLFGAGAVGAGLLSGVTDCLEL
nr:hypothetical protein [Flavobacterium sp. ASV13]